MSRSRRCLKIRANNEKEHAKLWFKLLHGGMPSTVDNLKDAAAGENYEWTECTQRWRKKPAKKASDAIAKTMEGVAAIEKTHEERYLKLLANIESGEVFVRKGEQVWECRNCGHLHIGESARSLPVCAHPKSYFMLRPTNY